MGREQGRCHLSLDPSPAPTPPGAFTMREMELVPPFVGWAARAHLELEAGRV